MRKRLHRFDDELNLRNELALYSRQIVIMYVDLKFRITAENTVSVDHGYHLYAALSRLLPVLHQKNEIGIHPIRGRFHPYHQLALRSESRLVLRTPVDRIDELLSLTGKTIQLDGTNILIGVPEVATLVAEPKLWSRLVVIKVAGRNAAQLDVQSFRKSVKKQISICEEYSEVKVKIHKRRTLKIKEKVIVGYEVVLENLTAEESLQIQIKGVGGRRHMGCGLFTAYRPQKDKLVYNSNEMVRHGGYGTGN